MAKCEVKIPYIECLGLRDLPRGLTAKAPEELSKPNRKVSSLPVPPWVSELLLLNFGGVRGPTKNQMTWIPDSNGMSRLLFKGSTSRTCCVLRSVTVTVQ